MTPSPTACPNPKPKLIVQPPFRFLVVARNRKHFDQYIQENQLDSTMFIYAPDTAALFGNTIGPMLKLVKLPGWQFDKIDEFLQRLATMEAAAKAQLN